MASKMEKSSKGKKGSEVAGDKQTGFGMSRVSKFVDDVKSEFGKIVWPNKKQTIGSTVVVVVLVMLISVYLGAVDLFLGKFIGYVLR